MPGLDALPFPLPTVQQVIFILIAGMTVTGALITALAPNLFHNALGLVLAFFGVAGVYVLLEAEFLAVSQVLIYVGAIATLITFAIMLAGARHDVRAHVVHQPADAVDGDHPRSSWC